MWEVKGTEVLVDWLDPDPVGVLYEFDGPRIFTCRDRAGSLLLAYQCGEDRGVLRYLIVPFSEDLEWRLTNGHANLREVLTQPRAWVVDLGYDWRVSRCWEVDIGNLPPRVLPGPGVMLWSHLRPLIRSTLPRPAAEETTLEPVRSFDGPSLYTMVA